MRHDQEKSRGGNNQRGSGGFAHSASVSLFLQMNNALQKLNLR
jgi:hypothetical protein